MVSAGLMSAEGLASAFPQPIQIGPCPFHLLSLQMFQV